MKKWIVPIFGVFSLMVTSFSHVALANSYQVSWPVVTKKLEAYYTIPKQTSVEESKKESYIDNKLDEYGPRLDGFEEMVNRQNASLSVKFLMKSTFMNGLPIFGGKTSNTNQDLINMMVFIFDHMDKHPENADADFKKWAEGFLDCQQVQYRTTREIYLDRMDKSSVKTSIAVLLDDLKRKWLMQTIVKMEEYPIEELDPHMENAYLKVIGSDFGLPGADSAKLDPLAWGDYINKEDALNTYRSFVNPKEIIEVVTQSFRNTEDYQHQASIFNWVRDKGYDPSEVYDGDGLLTQKGVEKILVDLGFIETINE